MVFLKDRRQHSRFHCTGHADVLLTADAELCPARIVNLSKGGCLIEFQKPVSLDQNATMELTFKVNRLPFRIRVAAVSIQSAKRVGLEFPPLSARVQAQLDELIDELAAEWRKRHRT